MGAVRAVLLALSLLWSFAASADVAVPQLTGRVVDQTGTLSSDDIASLTERLKDLEIRKGSQVAVLIVPTTAPETIEQYTIRVAEAWKIGRKKIDDGALLVVAKDDHHLRIEVGYGLEGSLTDVTAHRIIDEVITPKFKAGDFVGGISDGIDRIIKVIEGETLPEPEPPHWKQPSFYDSDGFMVLSLFGIVVLGSFLRAALGPLIGASAAGGIVAVAVWFITGLIVPGLLAGAFCFAFVMFSRGGYGGGFSGGGYSGGSSSGGGSRDSGGGFSGGGGSFGGGGASGSW
jgi:uncharacterized protein